MFGRTRATVFIKSSAQNSIRRSHADTFTVRTYKAPLDSPPFPPSNDKKFKEKKKLNFREKKKCTSRANFLKTFLQKIVNCEFCHSLFLFFIISYHWMGGKGGSPRYFNGNAPKYSHVNLVRSIGEHR